MICEYYEKELTNILKKLKSLCFYSDAEWDFYLSHFSVSDSIAKELSDYNKGVESNSFTKKINGDIISIPLRFQKNWLFPKEKILLLDKLNCDSLLGKKPIGIISGCFDLLHLGHIELIRNASNFIVKKNGKLIVLMLSDEEIQSKKGSNRPVLDLKKRLILLSNVKLVDYIVIVEEPNCIKAIKKIKPNYFLKPLLDNYEEIVKREMGTVIDSGGEVIPMPEFYGKYSTTSIIERVKRVVLKN